MADQRTMAQLLQAPTKGYEDAIVVPAITADNFELKHGLLTLVTNKQFFGHDKEDPHAYIRYFNKITSTLKFPNVLNTEAWDRFKDLLRACPYHGFLELYKLDTFYNALNSKDQDSLNSAPSGNFLDKMLRECLAIIESKSKVRYSRNKPVVSKVSTNTSTSGISPDVAELKDMVKALLLDKKSKPISCYRKSSRGKLFKYNQGDTSYRPLMMSNQIRPPDFTPFLTIRMFNSIKGKNQNRFNPNQNRGNNFNQGPVYQPLVFQPPAYQAPAYQALAPQTQGVSKEDFLAYVKDNDAVMRNMQTQGQNMQNQLTNLTELITKFVNSNSASTLSLGTLPSNTIANPRSELKAITTRSGVTYDGPQIPPSTSVLPKVVENELEATKDTVHPTKNGSTEDVQPSIVQSESLILNSEPVTSLISEPVIASVSAPKPNPKSLIPYPSRRNNERNHEKANNQIKKFYQIFKDMSFEISFADSLILMPKFASTLKALIGNKEKLSEMARTPLNEHYSVVLLKKLPKKLGDPCKFMIPCSFHFPADFVVVDFDADPRVPLILGRSFLKTGRALIDVFEGKITLRVGKEAITFNLDQTSRYSANYKEMMAKQIDIIDMAYEEYSQEVLGFSDVIASDNLTPYYDPIVSTTSLTLTPFGNSDFLLEEVDAFLAIDDDPTSPEVDQTYLDPEGDILLLEAFLNDDPSPPPNQGNYMPEVRKELKICEAKSDKSSIDEPLEVELNDLPLHLEYTFLEDDDKLPVNIAKDLSVEEKTALIMVLKSHKRAIAWKLSGIKGIDPEFYTHKILMEEDYEPAGGFTVVENEDNELILTRLVMGWRVCIDYRKLNEATRKDHFPLPFMDQMLKRLAGNQYYCFLDGFSGYFQIPIDPKDQKKTTFTCPYGTFAYHRMPFGLCNAPGTFQRCMMAIFYDMIEKPIEVFMDDFLVFGNSFQSCLSHLERMIKRCEDTNLCLNWKKSHFMVKEGIVIGHKISKQGIKVDKAKLTEAHISIAPDWDIPFELMCDASDFAIGAVLGQRQDKHFKPIHYARKTMTEAESNYTTTENEMLAVVGNKYILVAVDYLSKWVEAKVLPTNDARVVCKFLKNLFARFGTPRPIISDRGTRFHNDQFAKVMQKFGVTHRLATPYHPQTIGQVEVSNCGLKRILERTVGENRASWLDKLDDALWAFQTAYKTPIGCTPYKLVYGKACHLPIKLEHKAY
nr:reverse transcriptase domain-containing protein [Tanacetum cinerariifolium]